MAPDSPDAELVLRALAAAEHLAKDGVHYTRVDLRSADSVDAALEAAERALVGRLCAACQEEGDAGVAAIASALAQLGLARASVRNTVLAGRTAATCNVRDVLAHLRSFRSLDDLVDHAPAEVHRLGLKRALLSRVQADRWISRSSSVLDDPELAQAMVRVGSENPGSLTGRTVESEMLRRRESILVTDPQDNPRCHRELVSLNRTEAYVCAPVLARGNVVAVIHADQKTEGGAVDAFDRELIGLFAEGLGVAIERTMYFERLQSIRSSLNEYTRAVNSLVDEIVEADVDIQPPDAQHSGARQPLQLRELPEPERVDDLDSLLTRRELDVLRHLALGQTNAQIAVRLFVSEGTVKSHVKHIFRKLGAANRAEAVSRFHLARGEFSRRCG